jgi:hypothetical protein
VLHLTNGDCAIPALRATGVDEEILPWREVLHDGPVPAGLDIGDLSAFATCDRVSPLLDGTTVNERGRAVLAGDGRWEATEERWIGGIRIPPGAPPWEWDAATGRVRAGGRLAGRDHQLVRARRGRGDQDL